ncbi:hypothetical protein BAE44_0021166 [Dichanthelium oligosanthes]|uniref:Uncharacterized protein n=1 Tax=Dichanthelium oligosanthes TaxID=888268 RepID=A0A1E5UY50_9POAL|nr:hypothetical protein BAE44_0021166 [Dichanthelium oligosanthes]
MGWVDEPSYIHLPGARRDLLDNVGQGFCHGAAVSSIYHFFGGLRNSPNGDGLAGAARAVRAHAPRTGGSWAAFWGVWCVFENAAFFARGKDDPWNSIAGGAATSGFVRLRQGAHVATRDTIVTAAGLTLLQGFCILLDKHVIVPRTPAVEPPPAVEVEHVFVPPRGFLGIPPRAAIVKEICRWAVSKTPSYGESPDFSLRLAETTGWGFAVGAAIGATFHFQRGLRRSPSCGSSRVAAGAHGVRANALRVGGSLASFNALFYASEWAVSLARRHKEDRWNPIAAAAATCGILRLHRGPHGAVVSALVGASLMALVHGVVISFDRMLAARLPLYPSPLPPLAQVEDDLGCLAASVDHRPSP